MLITFFRHPPHHQVDYSRNGFESSFSDSQRPFKGFFISSSLINITIQSSSIRGETRGGEIESLRASTLAAILHSRHFARYSNDHKKNSRKDSFWHDLGGNESDNLSCKFSFFLFLTSSLREHKTFSSLSLFCCFSESSSGSLTSFAISEREQLSTKQWIFDLALAATLV